MYSLMLTLSHPHGRPSTNDLPALPVHPKSIFSITSLVYLPVIDPLLRQQPPIPSYPTPVLFHPLRDDNTVLFP